jgi:hypothetical protein
MSFHHELHSRLICSVYGPDESGFPSTTIWSLDIENRTKFSVFETLGDVFASVRSCGPYIYASFVNRGLAIIQYSENGHLIGMFTDRKSMSPSDCLPSLDGSYDVLIAGGRNNQL